MTIFGFGSLLLSLFLLLSTSTTTTSTATSSSTATDGTKTKLPDYLIIGAGGSGIQTALQLQKYGHTFKILEKENDVGSFWNTFPAFGELISVNKFTRNVTQRMRFDWHSFLDGPLLMRNVTKDYFPQGKDWQKYMKQTVELANIDQHIEFGVEVDKLSNDGSPCVVLKKDQRKVCAKYRMFIGTGMKEKKEPFLEALGGIPYSRMTREVAEEKTVCILGNGNAGYEVAQNVYDVADRVILYGKHPARMSAITRYTGDVRVKFMQPVENFHGKLLDTVYHFETSRGHKGLDQILNQTQIDQVLDIVTAAGWLKTFSCEVFTIATGFRSYVPGIYIPSDRRFPESNDWYELPSHPGTAHYIGWLMHERDFRRGAGGFLSGYRYLIRNLINHVNELDHGVKYPYKLMTKEQAAQHGLYRIQVAHDILILQDGVTVRDAIVPVTSDDNENYDDGDGTTANSNQQMYRYYEGITVPFHHDIKDRSDVIFLYFGWGDGRRSSNVFETVLRYSDTLHLINLFLHPVIEVNGMYRDSMEDLFMRWSSVAKEEANLKTLREALDYDLELFRSDKPSYAYERATLEEPDNVYLYEPSNDVPELDKRIVQSAVEAVKSDRMNDMYFLQTVRGYAKEFLPHMFPTEENCHADFCPPSKSENLVQLHMPKKEEGL